MRKPCFGLTPLPTGPGTSRFASSLHHWQSLRQSNPSIMIKETVLDRWAGSGTKRRMGPSLPHASTAAQTARANVSCLLQTCSRPCSRSSISRDTSSPLIMWVAGVPRLSGWTLSLVPRTVAIQSRYPGMCWCFLRRAASALSLKNVKQRPTGSMRPFCDPAIVTSTPHESISNSTQASVAMESTNNSAECRASSIAALRALMSWWIVVAVSV
mmetsp:Transcript_38253/g.110489  ORF Transcript_38253/g.110489 Transcript_38253/m.110489 type:complete len:213 (+) Transcript_38253:174-812(+)